MKQSSPASATDTFCFHCGERVIQPSYRADDHAFCCLGCQSVYQLLHQHRLGGYYRYNPHPGKAQASTEAVLEYLDLPSVVAGLTDFNSTELMIVTFFIPAIHCSSCVWLLENLHKLNPSIRSSRTDFLKKQVSLSFNPQDLSLKDLVYLLNRIGYPPLIAPPDQSQKETVLRQGKLVRKIAVAGFCFGNSMLLSFPEYFGLSGLESSFSAFFRWLNLLFSLPVLLYSGRDYFRSAVQSLSQRQLNLDVPLALGILVLFLRSLWDVASGSGAGFSDTLCGLVFFLGVGRWVQERTYYHLSFERDYRSYFPVAVTCLHGKEQESVPIADLKPGQRILIRHQEIVPADAILLKGDASIDFSFVTGESAPISKVWGEVIHAGGRQLGQAIELEVVKPVSQSYLTRLWNNEHLSPDAKVFKTFSQTVSRYFTPALLAIALGAAVYWTAHADPGRAWAAFTAVLIIGCPCALALSSPFTLSAALSMLDRHGFYLKNTSVVEQLARADCLVFDKTGTISSPAQADIRFSGHLDESVRILVASLCRHSNHPLSRRLTEWLNAPFFQEVSHFEEITGKGMHALVSGNEVWVGSAAFTSYSSPQGTETDGGSAVFVRIGEIHTGFFLLRQGWRPGLSTCIDTLKNNYGLHLISGDRDTDRESLLPFFPDPGHLHFQQDPFKKLGYIRGLQKQGHIVAMLGDGLNDAGALGQADLGIAVSDDINNFSPGCDAILDGHSFEALPRFFRFAKGTVGVIHLSFVISLLYNFVGLGLAVQGSMSPLFAAILMPLSTVTIISFSRIGTYLVAVKNRLQSANP